MEDQNNQSNRMTRNEIKLGSKSSKSVLKENILAVRCQLVENPRKIVVNLGSESPKIGMSRALETRLWQPVLSGRITNTMK